MNRSWTFVVAAVVAFAVACKSGTSRTDSGTLLDGASDSGRDAGDAGRADGGPSPADARVGDADHPGDGGDAGVTPTEELRAFPGALGAGAYATGGRGGVVCHVVSRDNEERGAYDAAHGVHEGTLRYCLHLREPRVVVFDVSGNFSLGAQTTPRVSRFDSEGIYLSADHQNLTIAGQTAPEGGVTLSENQLYFDHGARNIIIRYVRFRGGHASFNGDSLTFAGENRPLILDHCSFSHGTDENLDINREADATVSYSLFGPGKTGFLVGTSADPVGVGAYTVVRNVFANISHRFPSIGGDANVLAANNVVHNWLFRLLRNDPFDYRLAFVGNYLQKGVNTRAYSPANTNLNRSWVTPFDGHPAPRPQIVASGNVMPDSPPAGFPEDQTLLFHEFPDEPNPLPRDWFVEAPAPHPGAAVPLLSATEALAHVPPRVGARAFLHEDGTVGEFLDSWDANLLSEVMSNGTQRIPERSEWTLPTLPENRRGASYDTDRDGMPNAWETAMGFDPDVNDAMGDADGDGYTNLEEFLNLAP